MGSHFNHDYKKLMTLSVFNSEQIADKIRGNNSNNMIEIENFRLDHHLSLGQKIHLL